MHALHKIRKSIVCFRPQTQLRYSNSNSANHITSHRRVRYFWRSNRVLWLTKTTTYIRLLDACTEAIGAAVHLHNLNLLVELRGRMMIYNSLFIKALWILIKVISCIESISFLVINLRGHKISNICLSLLKSNLLFSQLLQRWYSIKSIYSRRVRS